MRLDRYIQEKWQFTIKDRFTKRPIEVFVNPTKSDYKDLLAGKDTKSFRYIADAEKKLFYVFDIDGLHQDVVTKLTGISLGYGTLYCAVAKWEGGKNTKHILNAAWTLYKGEDKLKMREMDWTWLKKWISNYTRPLEDIRKTFSFSREVWEAKVIDITDRLKKKKGKDFKKKIVGGFYQAKAGQEAIEAELRQKVQEIKERSKTNLTKFKYPTIMSDFKKGINPVEAMWLASGTSSSPNQYEQFARDKAREHSKEILKYLQDDLKKYEALLPRAQDAIAPQYARQIVQTPIHFTKRLIDFFRQI